MSRTRTQTTFAPPVMEARRWIDGVSFPENRPLLNLSQAAPVDPPPQALREAMAQAILEEPSAHLYGPVLGQPELRQELATQWSASYGGRIASNEVAITSGCNQAFTAAIATLTSEGDEIILPTPWYFNHKMWLDIVGVEAVPLPCGPGMLPSVEAAEALISSKTRAIALVSPNNPTGAEYPGALLGAFFDLCARHGIALLVDETYRDFDSRTAPVHDLFQREDWQRTFIHLYSFSKAYRLTGHRVGAMASHPDRLAEVEKFLDTVAICPAQPGQRGALWGLQNLSKWVAGERDEILRRRAAITDGFARLDGWKLLGCGAYFAYVRHPFETPSNLLAPELVKSVGVLVLPGTMFRPEDDPHGASELRIAFANADTDGIADLMGRLGGLTFS